MNKLSIIIPCYNEEQTIERVLKKIKAAELPPGWKKEIIVVDDGSDDNTREILKSQDEIKLIVSKKNKGKGAALKQGFKSVTGDYILIQDADLEYDPGDYTKLLYPIITQETDIVFGSRNLAKRNSSSSSVYYYGDLILTKIFNACFHTKLTDLATCYKLFPKKTISKLNKYSRNDFVFDVVELSYQLAKQGNIIEVPISYNPRTRQEGKKINGWHGIKCLFLILKLKFSHGSR